MGIIWNLIVIYGIFQLVFADNDQFCIFGKEENCFFECHCDITSCQAYDSGECGTCDQNTGECYGGGRCEHDTFMALYYTEHYWSGVGCQTGHVTISNSFEFGANGDHKSMIDRDLTTGVDLTFDRVEYWHVDLQQATKVLFLDIFTTNSHRLVLTASMQVHLGSRSGQGIIVQEDDVCTHDPDVDFIEPLKKLPPRRVIRIRFKCKPPSVGSLIAIVPKQTSDFSFTLNVMEVVVVGHKAVLETEKFKKHCQQRNIHDSNDELVWCERCLNSLPPTCENDCQVGYYGINCQQKVEPNINDNDDKENRYIINGTLLDGGFDINKINPENVYYGQRSGDLTIANISLIIVFTCIIIALIVGAIIWVKIKQTKSNIDLMTRNHFVDVVPPPLPPPRTRVNDHENVYCDIDQLHTEIQLQKEMSDVQHLKLGHSLSLNTVPPCIRPHSRLSLCTLQSQSTTETYLTPVSSKYLQLLPEMSQKHVEYFDVMAKGYDIPLFLQNGMAKRLSEPKDNNHRPVDSNDLQAINKCNLSSDGYLVPSSCRIDGMNAQIPAEQSCSDNSCDSNEYILDDTKDHYTFTCDGDAQDLSDGYYITSESGYSSF